MWWFTDGDQSDEHISWFYVIFRPSIIARASLVHRECDCAMMMSPSSVRVVAICVYGCVRVGKRDRRNAILNSKRIKCHKIEWPSRGVIYGNWCGRLDMASLIADARNVRKTWRLVVWLKATLANRHVNRLQKGPALIGFRFWAESWKRCAAVKTPPYINNTFKQICDCENMFEVIYTIKYFLIDREMER